jgi:hypothetical protein
MLEAGAIMGASAHVGAASIRDGASDVALG